MLSGGDPLPNIGPDTRGASAGAAELYFILEDMENSKLVFGQVGNINITQ